ncbi:iron transporter [Achromobacter veterisilvae]|uniref:Iron transporter n=1 Tax=Achromobacter veterisilvae TaxID=2069367 RepID=A0ABZ2S4D3_9BURK
MSKRALSLRYRLQVASRVVAAAVGGYALTSATIVLVALLLPLPRAQAVLASSMLGFVWYTLAVIAVFSVRTAVRAWLAIALPTAAIALVCAWLLPAAGSGP